MAEEAKQLRLRLPSETHQFYKELAKTHGLSVSSIIALVLDSYKKEPKPLINP